MKKLKTLLLTVFLVNTILAQEEHRLRWWNPINSEFPVISGQGWPDEVESIYHRLPARAENDVRKEVWGLSKQSAGLSIRFWSNADSIAVRYKVKGEISYSLIPSSGVSGLDLYAKTQDGGWTRCWGTHAFDTTICEYSFIIDDESLSYNKNGREYQLLLPLFNEVESLEIGTSEQFFFNPLPLRRENPIVAYGTSICQGANASRPGMSWANILERRMERPLINLGFSGNGRLEPELIDLIAEIDAKLYILDCLPNLTPGKHNTFELILDAVRKLKVKRSGIPVILTTHQGFANVETNERNKVHSEALVEELNRAFNALIAEGVKDLYLLEKEDLAFTIDSYADYGHPNDHGMLQYAQAYEDLIRKVLREPKGKLSTTTPVTQCREFR